MVRQNNIRGSKKKTWYENIGFFCGFNCVRSLCRAKSKWAQENELNNRKSFKRLNGFLVLCRSNIGQTNLYWFFSVYFSKTEKHYWSSLLYSLWFERFNNWFFFKMCTISTRIVLMYNAIWVLVFLFDNRIIKQPQLF